MLTKPTESRMSIGRSEMTANHISGVQENKSNCCSHN